MNFAPLREFVKVLKWKSQRRQIKAHHAVPFTMQLKVDKEFDRLVKAGILIKI